MSPATKSKSKDKRAAKEPQKSPSKPSGQANAGVGIAASGYNPLLGTFHALETAPAPSAPNGHVNGRFRNIEETDDQSGNHFGTGVEYDSVSNNGSWSGESEDHKEKVSQSTSRPEAIPGADNDKREKIRQKNEKKHQRQKERRAQELHEKCSGYLMSRKLESLAQQLVAMGFTSERATMALILNDGKVEESVAWLFEGGEDAEKHKEQNLDGGGNLKIDISDELACIADMELRYKCSKQEVERAIVATEGDLEKAEEMLKAQKQEPPAPPKAEETGDPPTIGNGKLQFPVSQNLSKMQPKPSTSATIQQKGDEKDFNYTKGVVAVGTDTVSKSAQVLKRNQPKSEWARSQQIAVPVERRWAGLGSSPPATYSVGSSMQASSPSVNAETQYMASAELKNLQLGSVREPVILMQRPQAVNIKPSSATNLSPPGTASGRFSINAETLKSNGLMPHISSSSTLSPSNGHANQMHNQHHYQRQIVSGNGYLDSLGASRMNGFLSRSGPPPTLAAASSLGLFSGVGSNGSPGSLSSVDWSTGCAMPQFDYTNVDWSLDGGSTSRQNGVWLGMHSLMPNNSPMPDSYSSSRNFRTAMRPVLSTGNGVPIAGLQHGVSSAEAPAGGAGGSREWTSPFEEKDIFTIPRQFVSSPSL